METERKLTSAKPGKSTTTNGSGIYAETMKSWGQYPSDMANSQGPLAASKLVKDEAEHARQNVANEILEAAKTVCGELIADTERTLEKARYLEAEAERKHVEAHEERERASEIRAEAEEYRESLVEDAKRQSAEHLEKSRAAAERESAETKQRASIEAEKMMAQAQLMRAAALEELEAQKIYAEAARFKSASQETLDQARNRLDGARSSALLKSAMLKDQEASPPVEEPVKNDVGDPGTDPAGHQGQIDKATALALGTIQIDPQPMDANGHMDSLEQLRAMQEAASRAVDAALAEDRKPVNVRRVSKRNKTNK